MVNNTELSEKKLIIKAQEGDLQAFSKLIKMHEQRLLKVASIIIPGEQEDVLQETFISAFRGIKNFRGNSSFYTWLYRILLNNIYRRFKQHKKKSCILSKAAKGPECHTQEEINREELLLLKEKVRKAVLSLKPKYQEIVSLFYFEEKTIKELSEILGLKEGTVKSRLFKARRLLTKLLSEPNTDKE